MNCPICSCSLETITYEGIRIETCPSCGGEWLDGAELKHIVHARETRFPPEQRRAILDAPTLQGVALAGLDRDLACPRCGATTDPLNYGADSGVIIDKCTGCGGFWMDRDELEKVQVLYEQWESDVPAEVEKHATRLRLIEESICENRKFDSSLFPFVNALINRILDLAD